MNDEIIKTKKHVLTQATELLVAIVEDDWDKVRGLVRDIAFNVQHVDIQQRSTGDGE